MMFTFEYSAVRLSLAYLPPGLNPAIRQRIAFVLAGVAAGLALAATFLLAFAPLAYQAEVPSPVGGTAGETTHTVSRSAVAVLGWSVLPLLVVPSVASLYLWARVGWRTHPSARTKLLLWLLVLALLGYATLTSASFGVFFGPSAGLSAVAVLLAPTRREEQPKAGDGKRGRRSATAKSQSRGRKRRRKR